jgi:hypothetical protein
VAHEAGGGSRRSGDSHGQGQCALLHGYRVYITGGDMLPSKPELEEMVRAAGGTCEKKEPTVAAKDLLVVSAKGLRDQWGPLKKLTMSVHSTDLLLSGLIQQQLNLKGTKL